MRSIFCRYELHLLIEYTGNVSLLEDVNLHFRIFILILPSYQCADNSDIHVDVSDFSREYRKSFDTQRFSRKSPPARSKKISRSHFD